MPWRRWVFLATGALVVTGAAASEVRGAVALQSSVQPVLTVNGHEVSEEEFRWFMEQERAEVFRYFRSRHGLDEGKDFWTQRVEGITPRAMLQSNAVARVVREKVEQVLFLELGLVEDIRYATFLAQLEKLNLKREQAARLGRTVYGPVRYAQLQYYQHWKASLQARAQEKLAEKQWPLREKDLRKFYDEHRALFRGLPLSALEVVTVRAEQKPEAARSAAGQILARLKAGNELTNALKGPWGEDHVKVSRQRFEEISPDRLGELFPDEQQLRQVLALAPGEGVLVVDSEAVTRVVRCLRKAGGEVRPYEVVQRQVSERWLAQQYDRHIDRLAGDAKVQLNQTALNELLP